MLRGSSDQAPVAADYDFADRAPFDEPGYPRLHFVERRYAGDASNWWLPNRACAEAMLRSAGFHVLANPHQEVFICSPDPAVTPSLPRAFGGSPRD
jgi:tRNA (mo5U34)-methyltransferase